MLLWCSFATTQVSPSSEPVQLRLVQTVLPLAGPLAVAEMALLTGMLTVWQPCMYCWSSLFGSMLHLANF